MAASALCYANSTTFSGFAGSTADGGTGFTTGAPGTVAFPCADSDADDYLNQHPDEHADRDSDSDAHTYPDSHADAQCYPTRVVCPGDCNGDG